MHLSIIIAGLLSVPPTAAPPVAPLTGLTPTSPASDIAWNVALSLWDVAKPQAATGAVPPPPDEEAYLFRIESKLLPIGPIVMTEDRIIKTLGRPPIVRLPTAVMRSSWRQPHNVHQQITLMTNNAAKPLVADPLPPAPPVTEP